MNNTQNRNKIIVALPYIVLLLVHIGSIIFLQQPHIFCDEIGYLGNARYLSGVFPMPDLRGCSYYHFGYSLFLIPAFWVSSNPVLIYKLVALINSALISSLYFGLYYFSRRVLGNPKGLSSFISFVICLYPSYLLQSNFAWAESLFTPLYVLVALSLFLMIKSKSCVFGAIFGFLSSFIYTVHPRALSIVLISLLFIFVLTLFKVISKSKAWVAFTFLSLIFIVTKLINSHLIAIGWGGRGELSSYRLISKLLSASGIKHLMLISGGQFLYLAISTYGLVLVGVFYVLSDLIKSYTQSELSQSDTTKSIVLLFVLTTSVAVFLTSSSFIATFKEFGGLRGDHLVYGRYNEGFLPLFLLFAFTHLYWTQRRYNDVKWIIRIYAVAVISAIALFLRLSYGRQLLNKHGYALNIFGIFPFVREIGWLDLTTLALIAIVAFLIISILSEKSIKLAAFIVGLLFLTVALYDLVCYVLPPQLHIGKRTTLASYISKLPHRSCVSYDMSFYNDKVSPIRFFSYQWLLPNMRFERFYSSAGGLPHCGIVISGNNWKGAEKLKAWYIASENGVDQALWIIPEKVRYRGYKSYIDVALGGRSVPGVWEAGFYHQEHPGGTLARWTNGHAKLVVPIQKNELPTFLKIVLVSTGPKGTHLRILVNGYQLLEEQVPPGSWKKLIPLKKAVNVRESRLVIEIISDTFVPKYTFKHSKDTRRLGVFVREIKLTNKETI